MKILNFFVICFLIASCQVRHDYKITGNVQGIPDSAVIDLYVQYENMGTRVASDTIVNGKFSFSDSIGAEVLNMNLAMRDRQKYSGICNIYVGNTDIEVSGKGNYLAAWRAKSNIKQQVDENKILDLVREYTLGIDSLYQVRTQNYQNNIDDKGMILGMIDSIRKIQRNVELDYLKNNYNSMVSIVHLCKLAQFGDSLQKVKVKEFYLSIDSTYLNTLWGEGLKNYLNKITPPNIGDKYVNFKAFDIDNKSHQLSDYIGKYILLDFWSMGCYPCIMSIPELRNLSAKYDNDLVVVGMNMETNKKFWVEASKKDSISWINLSDGKGTFGGATYIYDVTGFPTYILINREGVIVDKWMGFRPGIFNERVSKYFNNKK